MVNDKEMKKGYLSTAFVGGSMVASVFIYAGLVELISRQYAPFSGFVEGFEQTVVLRYVLIGVSVITFAIIGPLRRVLMSDKLATLSASKNRLATGPGQPFYGQFMNASVIVYALCETPSIYGLTLFLIAGNRIDFYIFMGMSLVGFAFYFPRYSQFKAWAVKREGGGGAEPGGESSKLRDEFDRRAGRYRR